MLKRSLLALAFLFVGTASANAQVSCATDPQIFFLGFFNGYDGTLTSGEETFMMWEIQNQDNSCVCPDRTFEFGGFIANVAGTPTPNYIVVKPPPSGPLKGVVTLKPTGCGASFATILVNVDTKELDPANFYNSGTQPHKYLTTFRVKSLSTNNVQTDSQFVNVVDPWNNTCQP